MNSEVKLPLFFLFLIIAANGLANDKEITIKPGWSLSTPCYVDKSGKACIDLTFPKAGENLPLNFGIPLGQVCSADNIALIDENGKQIEASFIPLGNWRTQPAHWVLVSTVLSARRDGIIRRFTIKWGNKVKSKTIGQMRHTVDGSYVTVDNGAFSLVLSSNGIKSVTAGGKTLDTDCWRSAIAPRGAKTLTPRNATLSILYDSNIYKKFRFESQLSNDLDLHQEFDVYAGSPFVRCSVRFINRTLKDIHLDGIRPVELSLPAVKQMHIGIGGWIQSAKKQFSVHQWAFGCYGIIDAKRRCFPEESSTEVWVATQIENGPNILLVFPYFRGMAAGEKELESVISYDGKNIYLNHYNHIDPNADVRLRETMARTFTYWLVVNPPRQQFSKFADATCNLPYAVYNREYLTKMGVFQEQNVSSILDNEVLEGALYFVRARVPRAEYPRCSRATEPEYDGEGNTEVNLHAGGMLFGEVFQYFTPKPSKEHIERFIKLGFGKPNIITGGAHSYRNGDIPLALFQQYLRTGNHQLYELACIHSLLYADYGVSHARGLSDGVGHYYCDWYHNQYVYQRFEGLALGYLVTGESWLLETARSMADVTVRSWRDDKPGDFLMDGRVTNFHQSRPAYIAKMNMMFYNITGEKKYIENAVRLAEWAINTQEPEGWWVMVPTDPNSRAYRCSPIFAGYISQGLWPLYWRTKNPELKTSLLKAAAWYLKMQEDARGSNPGTFPNSYWYGTAVSKDDPIEANYASTSQGANALLQAYLATGCRNYFYGSNAAWVGVINHQTPEGGIPLGNALTSSVWTHLMIESLPDFAATAQQHMLPVVLSSKTGIPGTSFMGKGATYDGKVFSFELKYKHDNPVPVRVYFPTGKPYKVTINDKSIENFSYNSSTNVITFNLPLSPEFCVCEITISR